ncbi:MAG: hypothetical protein ACTHMD_04890 [Flavisolibacter sp.]
MNYSTYWSILDTPSKTLQSNTIFLCIAAGAALLWFLTKKFKKDSGGGDKAIILWMTSAFGVLGIAGYVTLTFFYPDKANQRTLEMLSAPTTPRVEGVVSNFQRTSRNAKYGSETIEKFSVDSVQFAYGDAALGKFNSFTQTNNNLIFDGQRVRITYKTGSPYGNEYNSILRIEIAK